MPKNLLARSLARSTAITNHQVVRNQVSAGSRTDTFRFDLTTVNRLAVHFRSQSSGTQISLIRDQNQNGLIERSELLQKTVMRPLRQGRLNLSQTEPGRYFIQVIKTGSGSSKYQLKLAATPTVARDPVLDNLINQIVGLTNSFRQQNGLSNLALNSHLTKAAQAHTQNMALQDFVSHTGLDGSSVAQRVSTTGYSWSLVAENLAAGHGTAAEVVQGWIDSPSHRANLLNPGLSEIGIGYYFLAADPGTEVWNHYWTQVLATPQ